MTTNDDKIVSEFSLINEGKEKLQAFFNQRFAELRSTTPLIRQRAQQDLVKLVRGEPEGTGVFPKESLEELRRIVAGKSDLALLLTNCPERPGVEKLESPPPEESYGYHLGQALYQIAHIDLLHTEQLFRQSHKEKVEGFHPGCHSLHRDLLTREGENDSPTAPNGEYIIFVSPYNGENSITDIVPLRKAIESIPEEERREIKVKATLVRHDSEWMDLQQVLEMLPRHPNNVGNRETEKVISAIEIPEDGHNVERLHEAIDDNYRGINLQPGNLLFVDEKNMFHQGNAGKGGAIMKIPPESAHSRILYHMAGGPAMPL